MPKSQPGIAEHLQKLSELADLLERFPNIVQEHEALLRFVEAARKHSTEYAICKDAGIEEALQALDKELKG